jgi:Protein-arginine deiminase (PAD)
MQRTAIVWLALLAGCKGNEALAELRDTTLVVGVPNLDDDDRDDLADWRGDTRDEEAAPLPFPIDLEALGKKDRLEISVLGAPKVRIWSGDQLLLDEETLTVTFDRDTVPTDLAVEFGAYLAEDTLTVRVLDKNKEEVESVEIRLLGAPLILNHHLQPAEVGYIVSADLSVYAGYAGVTNDAMIAELEAALGDALVVEPAAQYGFDVWVQDEFETATLTAPGARIDVVIDSIRDRGLDAFPEDAVAKGKSAFVETWGDGTYPSSQDSFGNLEVSPPVTVDGVFYPFGRVYWGETDFYGGLVDDLGSFLSDQRVQDPFTVDVSFLCVGHIDEISSFVPDPTAPRGFRLLISDVTAGYALLDSLDPGMELPRYSDHGYATVGELAEDNGLRNLNEDYQRDYLDGAIDTFGKKLGVTEEEIIRIPALFEEIGYCGGTAAALVPGTVNTWVWTWEDGTALLGMPDPFFRTELDGPDPWIDAVEALLPAAVEPLWLDDWEMYHLALGEVHCGTNTRRTPTADWWTEALPLIDGETR